LNVLVEAFATVGTFSLSSLVVEFAKVAVSTNRTALDVGVGTTTTGFAFQLTELVLVVTFRAFNTSGAGEWIVGSSCARRTSRSASGEWRFIALSTVVTVACTSRWLFRVDRAFLARQSAFDVGKLAHATVFTDRLARQGLEFTLFAVGAERLAGGCLIRALLASETVFHAGDVGIVASNTWITDGSSWRVDSSTRITRQTLCGAEEGIVVTGCTVSTFRVTVAFSIGTRITASAL
jgi:hypothetical protein